MLEQPVVAMVMGFILGAISVGIILFFPRPTLEGNLLRGMGATFLGLALSTLVWLVALYAYSRVAPGGIAWFGVSTAVGFLVVLTAYAVRVTGRRYIGKRLRRVECQQKQR